MKAAVLIGVVLVLGIISHAYAPRVAPAIHQCWGFAYTVPCLVNAIATGEDL